MPFYHLFDGDKYVFFGNFDVQMKLTIRRGPDPAGPRGARQGRVPGGGVCGDDGRRPPPSTPLGTASGGVVPGARGVRAGADPRGPLGRVQGS